MTDIKKNHRKVLYELEKNARKNFTDIGKEAGISQQTVSYAFEKMQEKDIIKDISPLFDYAKFGYNGYLAVFRLNSFSREKIHELTEFLYEHEMVAWLSRLVGSWDLLVFFIAPNASYFNKEFKNLVSKYPDQLRTYQVLTSVVIHDMGRGYLEDTKIGEGLEDIILGGDRGTFERSKSEKETIGLLQEDPLRSSVKMGEKMGVTAKTVIERINRLEDRNLIKGYRPLIGTEELGISSSFLFIRYTRDNVEQEDRFVEYCKEQPNITLLMKTFGDWDVMLRIESSEKKEKTEKIKSIRENFGENILDYTTLEIQRDISKKYLPAGHFDPEAFQPVQE